MYRTLPTIRLSFHLLFLGDNKNVLIKEHQEVLDMIQGRALQTNIIQNNEKVLKSGDRLIKAAPLYEQIRKLWNTMRDGNRHM